MELKKTKLLKYLLVVIFLFTTDLYSKGVDEISPPDLTNWIISPNGGESFAPGATISVSINGGLYTPSTVVVELYKGSTRVWGPSYAGVSNRTISTAGFATGSDYRVRIFNASNPSEEDYSNGYFSISADISNWIISPNGGESFASGSNISVILSAYGNSLPVQVGLYKGSVLVSGGSTGGNSNRTVSTLGTVAGTDYRIRVNNANNPAEEDWSNGFFSITGSSSGGGGGSSCPSPIVYGQTGCVTGEQLYMTAESNASNIPSICSSTVSHKWYTSPTGNTTVPSFIESAGTCAVYKTRINVTSAVSYWVSVVVNSCESARVQVNASYQSVGSPASVTGASICGAGVATVSATPGVNGNSIRWYNTSEDVNELPFAEGVSYTSPTPINATTTYYVSSYNLATGCYSPTPRIPVTITVNPVVANPLGSNDFTCGSGTVTLLAKVGANGTTVRWYSYDGNLLQTGLSFTTPYLNVGDPAITYFIKSYNQSTDCESNSVQITASVRTLNSCLNYITSFSPQKKITLEATNFSTLPIDEVLTNTRYFDGLGRQMQNVSKQGSPSNFDIVTPVVYDAFGFESKRYLTYTSLTERDGFFKPSALNEQAAFYSTQQPTSKITNDLRPFSETVFEPSPLNRPDKEFGVGQNWKDNNKFIQHQYLINVNGTLSNQEQVIAWKVDVVSGLPIRETAVSTSFSGGYYTSSQLTIKSTKDEQGNEVREYVDKEGRTILKKVQAVSGIAQTNNDTHWAMTYYIYDDLGNLVVVLPPEAVKTFQN